METKIVSIEVAPTVQKCSYSKRFFVEAELVDENGEKHTHRISSGKKKELPEAIEKMKRSVEGGGLFVNGEMVIQKWVTNSSAVLIPDPN